MSAANIPWNMEDPPRQLVDLVESGEVRPCKAVGLGCGAGNYPVYLAGQGFDVTGVDISRSAVALTGENGKKGVACNLLVAVTDPGLKDYYTNAPQDST